MMIQTITEQKPLATWIRTLQPSPLQDLLALEDTNVISFALGLPAREFFPLDAFRQATQELLTNNADVLQYMAARPLLKQQIVRIMQMRGVQCRAEQIFLTTGAQQGLSLLAHLLIDPGDPVITETLTYTGMLRILAPLRPKIVTVPTSRQEGVDVHALEQLLRSGMRPALIYLVPDGHNPLGVCLSQEKRHHLAELVRHYQVPLIEDDPYGFLAYAPMLPPIRALEERQVLYVGSFSKVLAPALRIGWIVLPEDLGSKLSAVKEAMDLDSATFAQHVAAQLLQKEDFPAHVRTLQAGYLVRRDTTAAALQSYLPPTVRWTLPANGMYFWLELPPAVDTGALLKHALLTEKVIFMPGQAFCAEEMRPTLNGIRVCFSHCPLTDIEEGIRRLARVLGQAMPTWN